MPFVSSRLKAKLHQAREPIKSLFKSSKQHAKIKDYDFERNVRREGKAKGAMTRRRALDALHTEDRRSTWILRPKLPTPGAVLKVSGRGQ